MSEKPTIGITKPDNKDFFSFMAFWIAVKISGGRPLVLTASNTEYKNANIHGLLLGGGKDIFPGLYNAIAKENYIYDSARDDMEIFWAERARDEGIPTLGICRGSQLLNVVCGGTLHASVKEAYENAHYPDGIIHNIFYRKKISLVDRSLLKKITKRSSLRVNSIHKQAIDVLGQDLKIDAIENNGVVQALSMPSHPFYLGVQFHPEFLIYDQTFRKIFKALVLAAKKRL